MSETTTVAVATCPNCLSPVENHPENGCVVGALFQVLSDRGELEPSEIHRLHSSCNVDALWNELGQVVDRLANGEFSRD